MNTKTFHFSIEADVSLDVDEIWPDKNAPENPTLEDVIAVIRKDGGMRAVLEEWGLQNDIRLTVSDGKNSEVVK